MRSWASEDQSHILLFYRFLTSWPQLSVSLLPSPRQELQGAPPPTPTSSLGKCHLNGWLDLQFTLLWLWCDRSTDPLDHKLFKQVVQSTLAAEKNEELSEWGPESYPAVLQVFDVVAPAQCIVAAVSTSRTSRCTSTYPYLLLREVSFEWMVGSTVHSVVALVWPKHRPTRSQIFQTSSAKHSGSRKEWGAERVRTRVIYIYIYICLLCVWNWRIESDSPHQTLDVSSRVLVVSRETSGWCGSGLMVPML